MGEINFSDKELLEQFRNEDSGNIAFSLIVKKYQRKLYYVCRRIVLNHDDANDVIQEAFINIWKALPQFRQDAKLYTWMYRIVMNEALFFLKQKKADQNVRFDEIDPQLAEQLVDDPYFRGDEIQLLLQKAILTLHEREGLVFNMKFFEHMKDEEIAEVLEITEGAVRSHYHLSSKKIEKYLKTH